MTLLFSKIAFYICGILYFSCIEFDSFLFSNLNIIQIIILILSFWLMKSIKDNSDKNTNLIKVMINAGFYMVLLAIHDLNTPIENPLLYLLNNFSINTEHLFLIFKIFVPFLFFITAVEILNFSQDGQGSSGKIPLILRFLLVAIPIVASVLTFLSVGFDVPLSGALATSGLLTAIIGLALQGNLSNIISGIFLNLEMPFKPGDWINYDGQLGRVITISWRTTRLLTVENTEVTIPNDVLAKSQIENLQRNSPKIAPGGFITYDAFHVHPRHEPQHIMDLLLDGLSSVRPADGSKSLRYFDAWFEGATTSGLRFWVGYDCDDRLNLFRQRSNVMLAVNSILMKAGITMTAGRLVQNLETDTNLVAVEDVSQKQDTYTGKKENKLSNVYFASQNLKSVLQRIEIFAALEDAVLTKITSASSLCKFEAGDTIVNEGDPGGSMFVIIQGVVEILATDDNGDIVNLGILTVGDVFGEMSCLTGGKREATVKTLRPAVACEISKDLFATIIEKDPGFVDRLAVLLEQRQEINNMKRKVTGAETETVHPNKFRNISEKIRLFFSRA